MAGHGWAPTAATDLAALAEGLAGAEGTVLPDELGLWVLAGGRPVGVDPIEADDPARALGEAAERLLSIDARRGGSHYTPAAVADRVAAMALDGLHGPTVVDPACGGGALLLAAAARLAAAGNPRDHVARDLLWGADLDPLAAAVAEAAVALWSGGTAPAAGHVVAADSLGLGHGAWTDAPTDGFGVVVGNPPFQGQLGRGTVRPSEATAALRDRYGDAVMAYVDTAALFLLAATDLAETGGRVAMIVPQSIVAARDAGAVRRALGQRAALVDLWAPDERLFQAQVHVCVPLLETGRGEPGVGWADRLATARGVPNLSLGADHGTVGDLARAVAGFRDEYYGLVGHVREAGPEAEAPLVTSGSIDLGRTTWGERPIRFAKARWARPEVDLPALASSSPKLAAWVDRVRQPKVVVASQTRVVEAAADVTGTAVPVTPVVSVVPHDPAWVPRLAAVLCSPPVSAWALRQAAGSALSVDAIRVSAGLVLDAPLPVDDGAWTLATDALSAGEHEAYGEMATAMYRLAPHDAADVLRWWHQRRPS